MALDPRKGTFQLLEEFAVAYKAPKYTYKSATPELLESIRSAKLEENRIQTIKNYVIAAFSVLCTAALLKTFVFLNTHPLIIEYFR